VRSAPMPAEVRSVPTNWVTKAVATRMASNTHVLTSWLKPLFLQAIRRPVYSTRLPRTSLVRARVMGGIVGNEYLLTTYMPPHRVDAINPYVIPNPPPCPGLPVPLMCGFAPPNLF
jgi:hypothetical protein